MAAAAARRLGAPLPVRALATLLALGLSALPLWLLFRSLSVVTIEAIRHAPVMIDLIPLPAPTPPPPEPVPPARQPAHRLSAAPAPASAPPAAPNATIVTPPAPPPAAPGPTDGTGTAGIGIGSGSGGKGGGGDGGSLAGPVFVPATWAVVPGNPEIMPFDPPRAMRERVNGQVLLRCNVLATKKLANCRVVGERPRGYGFGGAALGASRVFLMNPPTRDGVPDEKAWVEIPVAFNHRR